MSVVLGPLTPEDYARWAREIDESRAVRRRLLRRLPYTEFRERRRVLMAWACPYEPWPSA